MQLSVFTSFFGDDKLGLFQVSFFQQLKPNNKPNFILSIRRVYKSFAHYNQPYVLSQ
jgi:hypothetical protein